MHISKQLKSLILSTIVALATTTVAWSPASVYAFPFQLNEGVKLQINDELVEFNDAEPFIDEEHRLLIPLRFVAEKIGYEVAWQKEEELGELIVTLSNDENELILITNIKTAQFNGNEVEMVSPVILQEGTVYAPLRFIADTLGILLQWDEQNHLAILSLNGEYRAPAWYAPKYEVVEVSATAYSASSAENGKWGAVDYFGNQLELGTIAVDPSIIPLGSKVYIEGYDFGHLPDGGMIGTALDIGGAVKGNRIDIFIPAPRDQVRKFGKQSVKVYIFD